VERIVARGQGRSGWLREAKRQTRSGPLDRAGTGAAVEVCAAAGSRAPAGDDLGAEQRGKTHMSSTGDRKDRLGRRLGSYPARAISRPHNLQGLST